jgi:uncharacterized protein (DUF849 family)
MRDMLPKPGAWASFGIAAHQFPMVAQSAILGGMSALTLRTTSALGGASLPQATQR